MGASMKRRPLPSKALAYWMSRVWRQRDSMTVHLVNLTNSMMMKGPLREVIPVGPQRVRVRLPDGTTPRKVHLLTAGDDVECAHRRWLCSVTVPSVDVHEVIAIDFLRKRSLWSGERF